MPEIYMGISLMAFSKYLFKIVKSVESTLLSLFKSAAFLNFPPAQMYRVPKI